MRERGYLCLLLHRLALDLQHGFEVDRLVHERLFLGGLGAEQRVGLVARQCRIALPERSSFISLPVDEVVL